MGQKRFIVSETFTSEDTGMEYYQGAIYEIDDKTKDLIEQWTAEGKVRDPDDEPEGDESDHDPDDEEDDDDKDDA